MLRGEVEVGGRRVTFPRDCALGTHPPRHDNAVHVHHSSLLAVYWKGLHGPPKCDVYGVVAFMAAACEAKSIQRRCSEAAPSLAERTAAKEGPMAQLIEDRGRCARERSCGDRGRAVRSRRSERNTPKWEEGALAVADSRSWLDQGVFAAL
ncbi:hypothetical protein cyc_02688 [Cyclospora cayetanensis]|uniref:Uncharacterized protein n=1 Tax=Cyclospora cayetanensis TaxID=88456 RepID=A0A1D3D720_9EIME|nr:hypothetical protein cyc_02688 [Cyclospora cayetanensis]